MKKQARKQRWMEYVSLNNYGTIVGGVGEGVAVEVGGAGVYVREGVKVARGVRVAVGVRVGVAVRVGVKDGANTRVGVIKASGGYNSRIAEYQSN